MEIYYTYLKRLTGHTICIYEAYILKSLLKWFMCNNLMEIAYLIETAQSPECMSHFVFKLTVCTDTRRHQSYSVRNLSRSCAVRICAIEFQRWSVAINKVARRALFHVTFVVDRREIVKSSGSFRYSLSSSIDMFDTRNTRH